MLSATCILITITAVKAQDKDMYRLLLWMVFFTCFMETLSQTSKVVRGWLRNIKMRKEVKSELFFYVLS